MKGGIGAAIFALEALQACGIELTGDVVIETVPDEETCAMGTIAAIARGYRADAGLVPEPTRSTSGSRPAGSCTGRWPSRAAPRTQR